MTNFHRTHSGIGWKTWAHALRKKKTLKAKFKNDPLARQFLELSERINENPNLTLLCNFVFESFNEFIPFDRIGLALIENRNWIRLRWVRSKYKNLSLQEGYVAPLRIGSLQSTLAQGIPRIINNLPLYLRNHPNSESTKRIVAEGVKSSLTCPLIINGQRLGCIFFSSHTLNTYKKEDTKIYRFIACELAKLIQQVDMSEKIQRISFSERFISRIAHDLRHPVTNIRLFTDMALRGKYGEIGPAPKQALEGIRRQTEILLSLIQDFSEAYKLKNGEPEMLIQPVSTQEFFKQIYEDSKPAAEKKRINLKFEMSEDAFMTTDFDPVRMALVLNNLLSNAFKFSNPETQVKLKITKQNNSLLISVSDQGVGIPQEELPELFKEFGKTSAKATANEESIGLGLYICKVIVEAHKGKIWAQSRVAEGSTFNVELPIVLH